MTTIRPLTPLESAEMLVNGWTCAKCPEPASERVIGPGAYRLCETHAGEVRERLRPSLYAVTLHRNLIGWAWTVTRDDHIIGQAHGLLSIFFRTRAQALQAAAVFVQHDRERHQQRLPT